MKYVVETNIGVVRDENQDKANVFENDKFKFSSLNNSFSIVPFPTPEGPVINIILDIS